MTETRENETVGLPPPGYGMVPDWARATRPLVIVFGLIAFVLTLLFKADVNAQGGAYATGVLVLISRATRSLELRATEVRFDEEACRIISAAAVGGELRIIANEPDDRDQAEYQEKEAEQREAHNLPEGLPILFLEVTLTDASQFETELDVHGDERFGYQILRVESPSVPNAIAALMLKIRDDWHVMPRIYFAWAEGNPFYFLFRYLTSGEGDVPPVTREVLRRAGPKRSNRPWVHVG